MASLAKTLGILSSSLSTYCPLNYSRNDHLRRPSNGYSPQFIHVSDECSQGISFLALARASSKVSNVELRDLSNCCHPPASSKSLLYSAKPKVPSERIKKSTHRSPSAEFMLCRTTGLLEVFTSPIAQIGNGTRFALHVPCADDGVREGKPAENSPYVRRPDS